MKLGEPKPWYRQKKFLIPIAAAATITAFATGGSSSSTTTQQTYVPVPVVQQESVDIDQVVQPTQTTDTDLSNDNYYTNVDGNQIHSPAYAPSIPAGASAQCRDGTYSFSAHRQGTCSHHGGVEVWY